MLVAPLLGSAASLVLAGGASAQVETVPSLTVTAGGAYSSSPFLQPDSNGNSRSSGAASTQLDVRPSVNFSQGTDSATVSANYNRADYFSRYGSNSGYGVSASGRTEPNARTSLGVSVAFDSQILGGGAGFITPLTPPAALPGTISGSPSVIGGVTQGASPVVDGNAPAFTPVTVTPVNLIGVDGDVGLIGLRQRRNLLSAEANGSYRTDPRSTWNGGLNISRSSYPGVASTSPFVNNFNSYGGSLGYSRALTEISTVGFQVAASYVDYDNGFASQIYTPRATYSTSLSERLNLSLAAGAAISRQTGTQAGVTQDGRRRVTVSVNGSLCRTGERSNGCVTVSRTPTVTGFGGVRTQTDIGASFSYRFNPDLSGALSANYSRVGAVQGEVLFPVPAQDIIFTDASLQRRLGRRLSAVGSVSYRRGGGGIVGNNINDVTGRLGLSFSIGRFQ
ncbi:hypothetical protein GCM10011380_12220 [Sphingomonas metalli]|uniref:Preprotein translocase subunit YajC n=2 Tax=Sphingomonas metalli TaxID=1779358 RepID=A0A916WS13_9SPHN|nr:hypothetical protein GCM10011380_12220 [Sphingomonas metalli]